MAKRRRRRAPRTDIAELDIIIPVYGRPDLLAECLASLEGQEVDYRLFVVDDQGPEQPALGEIYRSLNGTSRVVQNATNQGFARTVNRGVSLGSAPLVLLLNSDVTLQPGALQAMMTEFDDNKVGVVGPKLLFPATSHDPTRPAGKVQHAGLAVNFQQQLIHANIGWPADHPRVNVRREMQAVSGACLMTRRVIWDRIKELYRQNGDPTSGGLNEVYGAGTYEDVEYCFAARSEGWQVIYTPGAVGEHYVGASVTQEGGGYPIRRNEMIFRARCGTLLVWDEWRFW